MRKKRIGALLMAISLSISMFSACDGGYGFINGGSSVPSSSEETSAPHEHVFGEDWKHNSSVHWHVCECGEQSERIKHSGGEATCEEKALCEVCGREYGKVSGHTYSQLKELDGGFKGYECSCGAMSPLLDVEKEDGTTQEGLVDFVVEVEMGREPVILQLSDTQLTDKNNAESRCYKYIRETVAASNPDLILITGDLVYGCFDKDGNIFRDFIAFMETLKTPWAPVFGNHDNECWLGVDWQCEQLEAAEYCLFEQGNMTGNGNYSVGILQGNNLLRVFYMMDSNGCSKPRVSGDGTNFVENTEQTPGKNLVKKTAGFENDQVYWLTNSMQQVTEVSPATKLSVAYHIQQAYITKAYEPYGYTGRLKIGSSSELETPLDFDSMEDAKEGDIGYLGRAPKGPWDSNHTVFLMMKNLGVDSLFVGHEHCNSASVVLDGIRFQYGQKSSTYDRYNVLSGSGNIVSNSTAGTPLIGGTVFFLSQEDGAIVNPYIYLCGNPLGRNPKA